MTETPAKTADNGFARRLRRARLATLASMMVERGWPLLLPLLVVASLFVSLSWLGVFRILPELARFGLLGVLVLGGLAALYPLRFYRQPSPAEVDRRIEAASQLPHTPVLVQTDRPSGPQSAFSQALWREHQRRMAEKLGNVDSDLPRTRVPERDPWGLRDAAALLLVVAFAFSQGPLGGRIADAFRPGTAFETIPPRIDAWVTPPSYTGKPPLFLTAEANSQENTPFTVPQGSEVSLRVTGGTGDEALSFTDAGGTEHEIAVKSPAEQAQPASEAAKIREFAGKLDANGVLRLTSEQRELRRWAFSIIPNTPPTIRFLADPKQAANGALELNYEILDQYGAASAKAQFELADPQAPNARPLYKAPELPLALPRRGGDGKVKMSRDLTDHAWAGATVKLTLKVTDAAGQEATSETKTFRLPERPFANPLARAVVEQRRIFSVDANRKPYVLDLIDAVTSRPEDTIENLATFLGLMAGRTQLKLAKSDDQLRATADYFWEMALAIEDGALSTAEKRLRQAQEALKQALQNGASDEQIDKLMQELRQAMNDFLREFAERAKRDPNLAQQMQQQGAQELRQSDLQRMMDQIENLAKSGNRDQAEQLLSQLQDMMNNLQANRQQQPGQGGEQSEMQQQMNKLGEIMRRQQQMMNDTFRLDQMQRGQQDDEFSDWQQSPQGNRDREAERGKQGQGQQGQNGHQMTPEEYGDALKQLQEGQGNLQKDLQGLTKGLEDLGIQPGKGFGEAGDAMGQAKDALGEAEGNRAVGEQGRALEALRRGAQDMMKQLQAQEGDQGKNGSGGQRQNAGRDPLGRPQGTNGPDFGNSVKVPDEIDVQRARQILDAIRKRLGNAMSPELEKRYLERLLDMH